MTAIDHARYTCGEVLGEGAQGLVVRVVDRERPALPLVAKITSGAARSVGTIAHLEGEFALLARLRVPGLVRVHDLARDRHGMPFLVEDFVEGEDPARWVGADAARFVTLAASLAETLAALHDSGFLHGDIKPANVRVPAHGRAMLLDLGAATVARSSRTPSLVFTPAFAAPELRAGAPPSVATDLHALGATLWACAAPGTSPSGAHRRLRDHAPWVTPSIAAVIEGLVAEHPADRPHSAGDVLAALGRSAPRAAWEGGTRGVHVREAELVRLVALAPGVSGRRVVYVSGSSGAGKSHLVRELGTRALLAGRTVRQLRFPVEDAAIVSRLVAYLRGDEGAAPWEHDDATMDVTTGHISRGLLLVLDDLHAASAEVLEALDAFRCMTHASTSPVLVVAANREAAVGAETIVLAPLDSDTFAVLCRELGAAADSIPALHRETGGLPGWAVAALGRVPLTRDAVLARVRELDPGARDALALVATLGGTVPAASFDVDGREASALFVAGLLERDRELVRLASPQLARDLAEALASFTVSDRAAEMALGREDGPPADLASTSLPAASLLAAGCAPSPPARRLELLERAAAQARREGARAIEIDALLALTASPELRTAARLARLERLTRDAGTSRAHPQVLTWLEEAATRDVTMRALAARRRAEERARAGDHDAARASAERAVALAKESRDDAEEAYALATKGAVMLFAAAFPEAAEAFDAARVKLSGQLAVEPERVDREEIARLEHNVGVVALYRGRVDTAIDAFERSVGIKRALGDRAGVRSCLLNLGIALTRRGRHDEAERALVEATALAEALGQAAGRAWCLTARADLEVRRGRARDAEQLVAEGRAIGDALPAPVRADLVLLSAQIALLEGDGRAAIVALASLDEELRTSDALVDARALVLEARGRLAILPVDRRAAARAAIRALRRARAAGLGDVEQEATETLRVARRTRYEADMAGRGEPGDAGGRAREQQGTGDEAAWSLVAMLGREAEPEAALRKLAALVVEQAGAERAIIASLDEAGRVQQAWGVDVDGLPIAEAEARVDEESLDAARRREGPVYQADVVTRAGRGARLTVAGVGAAVVVEHRFRPGAFDHVTEQVAARWGVIAEVGVRLARARAGTGTGTGASERAIAGRDGTASVFSTAMPRRDALREFPEIMGRSPALRRALAQLDAAIDTDLPALVHGETGTGKELFARALHDHGPRSARPFVAVNCAAIADALFEAELFGHARGAFTGADRARPGLLARAEGGTLLLDEIGELPLARQATLLRVLESKRFRAVGSDDERAFDVRIVAATNRDLDAAVEEGTFRRDLLYRLRVLDIAVPSLRDRAGDIELLARHFLAKTGSRATLAPAAIDALCTYPFPGNVRELLHVAQRLAAAHVDRVEVAHLPRAVRLAIAPLRASQMNAGVRGPEASASSPGPAGRPSPDDERADVEAALSRTGGNISRAAVLLGLSRHGLKKRMLRLGLRARAGEQS